MGQIIKTGSLQIDSLKNKQILGSDANGTIIDSGLALSGSNTGDETTASILAKLGISSISGLNTGDNATNSQYSGLASSKQDLLVSTSNIKTINGQPILGSGNLTITVTGGVVGPVSSISDNIVLFDGVDGKLVKDSGLSLSDIGASSSTDESIARYDGITGKKLQNSLASLNDAGEITTPGLFIDCDSDSNSSQFSYGYGYDPSIAEYYNKRFRIDSFLESPFFSAGVARNYLLQSEALATSWTNTGGTLTSNDATLLAPNGSATAEKIVARTGFPTDNILQTITNTATGYWSAGIWARTLTGTGTITLEIYSNTEAGTAKTVNLDTKWRFFAVKQNLTTAHANKTFKITYGETSIQLWGGRMNPGETCNAYRVTTSSALTTATPGIFFNNTNLYAANFFGALSGNATTSSYSIGGNYGSTTLSNTTDNTAKWELLGTLTLSYNATYSYGQSINQVINLSEYSESEAAKASANYEDIYLTIKGTLPSASGSSATFNTNVPTLSMMVSGTSTLTGADFAILVFSTTTASKVLRVYAKLKNPNTHYIVNPVTFGNLSYSSALTPSISYITWASAPQTAVLTNLPTPAQGSVVNATIMPTGGDVVGPAGATADAIARYNSTTGKLLKDSSLATIDDSGNLTAASIGATANSASTISQVKLKNQSAGTGSGTSIDFTTNTTVTGKIAHSYIGSNKTKTEFSNYNSGLAIGMTLDADKKLTVVGDIAAANLSGTNTGDLVSGTTIKTINSQSLLGSGDIVIAGAGGDMLLGTAQTVTADKTFNPSTLKIAGSSTGVTSIASANASATNYTATFPAASITVARSDAAQTFTGVQTMTSPAITTSITTGSTSFTALAGATTLLTLGGTGASASTNFPSTLDTTSSVTGAIRTAGGISAAKALNVGTTITGGSTINAVTGYKVNNAATSRTILVGNGTNFVQSTETYATPGTSGNVLTSDGTNWTSAAPTSGGTTVYKTVKLGTQADGDDNKTFSLSTGSWSDSKYLMVFLNGVLQEDGAGNDYTIIDTNTIEFVNVVADTDKITLRVQQ